MQDSRPLIVVARRPGVVYFVERDVGRVQPVGSLGGPGDGGVGLSHGEEPDNGCVRAVWGNTQECKDDDGEIVCRVLNLLSDRPML